MVKNNSEYYRKSYAKTGFVEIPIGDIFSKEDVENIYDFYCELPEETVLRGDAGENNNVNVRRVMEDRAGARPNLLNTPISEHIVQIINSPERRRFFEHIFSKKLYLRRCQIHRMVSGNFVGKHLDDDSNPIYMSAIVMQLGKKYSGGDFVIYPENAAPVAYNTKFGSVVITRSDVPHEVEKVIDGERISLVWFLAASDEKNVRLEEVERIIAN